MRVVPRSILVVSLVAGALGGPAAAQQSGPSGSGVTFSHALPRMNDEQSVQVVEVRYAPGDSSVPHSHPCPVVGYVIEGALRVAVDGDIDSVFTAGQSFYEAPNGVHRISANASRTEPVRFVAFFVCDRETPLSIPVPAVAPAGSTRP